MTTIAPYGTVKANKYPLNKYPRPLPGLKQCYVKLTKVSYTYVQVLFSFP